MACRGTEWTGHGRAPKVGPPERLSVTRRSRAAAAGRRRECSHERPAMIGIAHAVLRVGLCAPIARTAPQTAVAIRVRLVNRRGTPQIQRDFRFERGDDDNPKIVELDAPQGTYRLDLTVPRYGCSASQYVTFLPDVGRSIAVTLDTAPPSAGEP